MSKSLNIRVFKHKILIDALTESELHSLTKDFRYYKETGQKPEFFGRDEAYDHPNTLPILKSEEVKHIHLAATDALFLNSIQFRCCPRVFLGAQLMGIRRYRRA